MKSQFVAWSALAMLLAVLPPAHATSVASAGATPTSPTAATSADTVEGLRGAQPATASTTNASPAEPMPVVQSPAATEAGIAPQAPPAVAAEPPKPVITLRVTIDLAKQQMTVDPNGETSRIWAISSARRGYRTPTGTFAPTWKARMWYSRQYDSSPMPHSIFFKDGVAIHGTSATGMLGRPASHGCVRLAPKNAAALYAMVGKHGMESTRIVVHGSPRFKGDHIAGRTSGNGSRYSDSNRRRNHEGRQSSNYAYGGVPFWAPWQ